MAVRIDVVSSKYYKQWANGSTFASSLSNYTDNFTGSVMQKVRLLQQLRIENTEYWEAPDPADPNTFPLDFYGLTASKVRITRNDGGNWFNDGFVYGDMVDIEVYSFFWLNYGYSGGSITFINDIEIQIEFSIAVGFPSITSCRLFSVTPLKSLIYKFGLVENSGNYDIKNLATNEDQVWYSLAEIGSGSPRSTAFVSMGGVGIPNSWKSGSCRVRYVSGTGQQIFEIEHTFIIPYYRLQDYEDFFNDNLPPPYLLGDTSLKYVFETDFRTVISNPNTSKKVKYDMALGSVGFYGETFNGFDSNYQVNSVTYTDSLLSVADGILIGGTTLITVEIQKISGNFGTDNVGVYFSYVPELQAEVENLITDFETNFVYDNIFAAIGSASTTGTNVFKSCQSTAVTNILTIEIEVSFTAAQQLKFSNEKKYILGFEVGDTSLSAASSDVVILKETANFDDSSDIPDLMTFDVEMYPYTEDFSTAGVTDFRGWNEHGIALKGNFILDLTKSAFINSFEILLVAYKTADGSYFELDKYPFVIDNTIVTVGANDYQTLILQTDRGYQLPANSEKNGISILPDTSTFTGTSPKYNFKFAQKISWEDWIKNFDANPIFTNLTKPQNNLNFKASNYSNTSGYKIRMLYKFNVAGVSYLGVAGNTDYLFFSPDIRIHNYDVDGNTPPNFTQTIETFTADGITNLGGAVQSGVDTLFKITWSWVSGAIINLSDYWGIHRIEETGQIGKEIFEFGSYETNETTNNLLKAISGNFLTMALVGGDLVTSCLIDGSKIQSGVNYNLSGEIASPPRPKGNRTFTNKILEVEGTAKFTENTLPKIKE